MKEGWHHDEYLLILSPAEADAASSEYAISRWLPGYKVVGLRGWDDLLVQDAAGSVFSVPSVPIVADRMELFAMPPIDVPLTMDPKYSGKVKWHLQPLVFGGHPTDESNVHWVTFEQHAQLVVFWNDRYQDVRAAQVGV